MRRRPTETTRKDAATINVTLWITALALAFAFLASGASKVAQPREKLIARGYAWAEDFSPIQVKAIGVLEVMGAVGLVVPPAVGVLEVLSPVAAAGLAGQMTAATLVHVRRDEKKQAALPAALGIVSAALAVLRFGPYAF